MAFKKPHEFSTASLDITHILSDFVNAFILRRNKYCVMKAKIY